MVDIIANITFVMFSFGISTFMVLWYSRQMEIQSAYPYQESIAGWVALSIGSPIKSASILYGQDTSMARKDFYGVIIFSITFFTLTNFVYFRGHLENGGVLLVAIILFVLFFSLRQYFAIKYIYQSKPLINALKENHQQLKKRKKELERLQNSILHLKKRARWVENIYMKWERPYEKLLERKEDMQWSIDERKKQLNGRLRALAYNMEKFSELDSDTILALDANILMMADDYIIEEIKKFPILISKRVQQEWDKNKTSEDKQKGYRARRAIRRLVERPHFEFTVSKWQDSFLKKNNLMKGIPDEEIIADYLYEKQQGKNIVVLSGDLNFQASAKVHMPIIAFEKMDTFS